MKDVQGPAVDELLTIEEVADRFRTSQRFVRRLIAERRIAFTKVGKFVRIRTVDVEAFIAAGRVEPGHLRAPVEIAYRGRAGS